MYRVVPDRLSRKLATLHDIVGGCGAAVHQYGEKPWRVWMRFLGLYWKRFSPREVFLWGLLDPALSPDDLQGYLSKDSLLRFQRRYNPSNYVKLMEDKAVFYTQCIGAGMPVPRLLAVFSHEGAWLADKRRFVDLSEMVKQVEGQDEQELVIKPAEGVYGRGVRVLRRTNGLLMDQSGTVLDAHGFEHYCQEHADYRRFILQERIFNHNSIQSLTGVDTLQTVRVITVSRGDGAPGEVVLANWRLAVSDGVTDNFDYGRDGNFLAQIDVATGLVKQVVGAVPDRQGIREVHQHPVTGMRLAGFGLPDWDAVRAAVLAGTVRFAPLRLIGWDVALTDKGPILLEANAWFDAGQNAFQALPAMVQRARCLG